MVIFRSFSLVIGILGLLFFGSLFSLSYKSPQFVEQTTKEVIYNRLITVVDEKIASLSTNPLFNKAQQFFKRNESEINKLKQQFANNIPERITIVMNEMIELDDNSRYKIELKIQTTNFLQINSWSQLQQKLTLFIQGKYLEIIQSLKREFRIFTGTNSLAFLFLIAAVFIKRKAGMQLLIPAMLLLISTAIASYFYIFNQNWLHTILFSNYVGFGYITYIGIIFAFLCDIVLFSGFITSGILNTVTNKTDKVELISK